MKSITVALGQIQSHYCNPAANVERHVRWVHQAKEKGARLIVFPELSLTGYYLREAVDEMALPVDDSLLEPLIEASDGISVIFGFVERGRNRRHFNSAALCENGSVIGIHRKNYLPTYDMFEEGRYFASGKRVEAFRTSWGVAGIVICEDSWHPDLVLQYREKRIDVLVIISASPLRGFGEGKQIENHETHIALSRFYARNLGVPVIYVNKIGYESGIYFWGGAAVYSPDGRQQIQASLFREEQLVTDVSL